MLSSSYFWADASIAAYLDYAPIWFALEVGCLALRSFENWGHTEARRAGGADHLAELAIGGGWGRGKISNC